MRTKVVIVLLLLVAFCSALFYGMANRRVADDKDIDSLLIVLDATIKNKSTYIQLRQNRIDSLKRKLAKETRIERQYDLCHSIYNDYFDFQNDYAMDYVVRMCEIGKLLKTTNPEYLLSAQIDQASLLRYTGQLKESIEILNEVMKHKLPRPLYLKYLSERITNYTFLRDNTSSNEYDTHYNKMVEVYRDSLFTYIDPNDGLLFRVDRFLTQQNPEKGLDLLLENYNKLNPLSKRAGTLAYKIATCYKAMGDVTNTKRYLVRSAIADLQNGVRGYKSLQHLASVMYNDGDIDRGYYYIKCSIEDAIMSSARIRAQEAAKMFVLTDESYKQKIIHQKQEVIVYLCIIGVVGVLLFFSLMAVSSQYSKLLITKRNLDEANRVKEVYLGVFIEEYSNYLSRMNSYRMKSFKLVKTANLSTMEQFLDEALNTTAHLKELYRKFDATILHIFPSFPEEFNRLMTDMEEAKDRKPCGEKLTTEQRIAAVIRLGITDTEKIALFLHYAIRTVYNNRSQMRMKAKNPQTLDEDIMRIGLAPRSSRNFISRWLKRD